MLSSRSLAPALSMMKHRGDASAAFSKCLQLRHSRISRRGEGAACAIFCRPDHAAEPRLLDGVGASLDRDLVGEMITVPTVRTRRSAAAEIGHARYNNALVIAQRLQLYVRAGAALGRAAQPLAAEQVTLQSIRFLGVSAASHRVLHWVGEVAAGTWRHKRRGRGAGRRRRGCPAVRPRQQPGFARRL